LQLSAVKGDVRHPQPQAQVQTQKLRDYRIDSPTTGTAAETGAREAAVPVCDLPTLIGRSRDRRELMQQLDRGRQQCRETVSCFRLLPHGPAFNSTEVHSS
jgi:hypothetical protein